MKIIKKPFVEEVANSFLFNKYIMNIDVINHFFLYYAIFSIVFSFVFLTFLEKSDKKIIKKHVKKRKSIFTFLAFLSLLLLWAGLEKAFLETTISILWYIHISLFFGYFIFSVFKYSEDKKRIEQAEARRLRRNNKK